MVSLKSLAIQALSTMTWCAYSRDFRVSLLLEPVMSGMATYQKNHQKEFLEPILTWYMYLFSVMAPNVVHTAMPVLLRIWLDCFLSLSKLEDNTVLVPYSIGRKDCDSSQGMLKRNLPGHTLLDGVSYLKDAFDLNTKEAVALLGKYMCMHSQSCVYMLNFYMEPLKLLFTFWERLQQNYYYFAYLVTLIASTVSLQWSMFVPWW